MFALVTYPLLLLFTWPVFRQCLYLKIYLFLLKQKAEISSEGDLRIGILQCGVMIIHLNHFITIIILSLNSTVKDSVHLITVCT